MAAVLPKTANWFT